MANYIYGAIALTGGGTGALDAIDGAGLTDKDMALVVLQGTGVYFYAVDADSAAAESSPWIIAPDINAGDKRWILHTIPPETSSELTIATDVVTVRSGAFSSRRHTIDTESDAATDDLTTINGGNVGELLIISAANATRTVVCKNGAGLILQADFSLDDDDDTLVLECVSANVWREISRSNNAA